MKYRLIQRKTRELLASSEDEGTNIQYDSSENQDSHCNENIKQHSERTDLYSSLSVTSSDEVTTDDDSVQVPVDSCFSNESLQDGLAVWASQNNITRQAMTSLLGLLRKAGHDLPKDARTLLQTPRCVPTTEKCGGKYSYFGIESCLRKILSDNLDFIKENNSIKLIVNVDGIPLYKSSNDQFWPILVKFSRFRPALVALFCGKKKPDSVENFLSDFLEEYKHLSEDGLVVDGRRLKIYILCFVCDAPARSFLKCIKGHTGYYSCERCEVKGIWDSHIIFDSVESYCKRTDERFTQGKYRDTHQLQKTSLIQYGIPCVTGFPLDYMHLVCLGVTRRMLLYLIRGPKQCRLSQQHISIISASLEGLSNNIPSEFARKPRSLTLIDRWKATEFRQYILYTSVVVLKDVVSSAVYKTSLSLTVALSILLNSDDHIRNSYLQYARELLLYFVQQCREIYGRHFVVYNIHGLVHLPDDVENYQCSLNDICAFPFENHLQRIKKLVRSSNNPISQVSKRLSEKERKDALTETKDTKDKLHISTKWKDNCFMLHNEDFVFLIEELDSGYYTCDYLTQSHTESFFTNPCNSKLINIVFMKKSTRMKKKVFHFESFHRKVVKLPYRDGIVLIPVLHDLTT